MQAAIPPWQRWSETVREASLRCTDAQLCLGRPGLSRRSLTKVTTTVLFQSSTRQDENLSQRRQTQCRAND